MKNKNYLFLVAVLVVVVLFSIVSFQRSQPDRLPESSPDSPSDQPRAAGLKRPAQSKHNAAPALEESAPYPTLTPSPMKLTQKQLTREKWNSGTNAFARLAQPEGISAGPSSLMYLNGVIYVLDSINSRLLGYDREGHIISSVSVPVKVGGDLAIDSSDSSLLVIDHYKSMIYKVKNGVVTPLGTGGTPLRDEYPIGTRFTYDSKDGVLVADEGGNAEIGKDGKFLLTLRDGRQVALAFDRPAFGVEQMVTDGKGNTWMLYMLEGDERYLRLARIGADLSVAEMSDTDVWFANDGTRRMTPTENGILVLAGDAEEGRLLYFERAQ